MRTHFRYSSWINRRRHRFVARGAAAVQLVADALTAASPEIGAPDFTQVHAFAADAIAVASPEIGAPDLTQNHVLTADALAVASPDIGAPVITQTHALAADDLVVSSPAIGSPAMAINLPAADNLTVGSPTAGTPIIEQIHALAVDNIDIGSPVVSDVVLVQVVALAADGITASSPVITEPSIGQKHLLRGQEPSVIRLGNPNSSWWEGLDFGSETRVSVAQSFKALKETINDVSLVLDEAISVNDTVVCNLYEADGNGRPTGASLAQSQEVSSSTTAAVYYFILDYTGLTPGNSYCVVFSRTGALASGTAPYGTRMEQHVHYEDGKCHRYDGSQWVEQVGRDLATKISFVGRPEIGSPYISSMTAPELAVGSPVIGTPTIAQHHVLTAGALAVASPEIGAPEMQAGDGLFVLSWEVGSPAIGSPALTQDHQLSANGIDTASPVIDEPFFFAGGPVLTADNLTAGSPEIGAPDLVHHVILSAAHATQIATLASVPTQEQALGAFFTSLGQSFEATFAKVNDARFHLARSGADGNIYAELYELDESGFPTGSALATSGQVAVSSIPTSAAEKTFTFAGGYTGLTQGVLYAAVLRRTTTTGNVYVRIKAAGPDGYPKGKALDYYSGAWHHPGASYDYWCQINGEPASPVLGAPVFSITDILQADDLVVGSPIIGSSELRINLAADALVVASPEIGVPDMVRVVNLKVPDPDKVNTAGIGNFVGEFGTPVNVMAGQQFRAAFPLLKSITMLIGYVGSSPSSAYVEVYEQDGSGFPTGSPVATSQVVSSSSVPSPSGQVTFNFDAELVDARDYVVVLRKSEDPSPTRYFTYGYGNQPASGGYPYGARLLYQSAAWSASAATDLYCTISGGVHSPEIGAPEYHQSNLLEASAMAVGSPAIGSPALAENYSADGVTVDAPEIGTPMVSVSLQAVSLQTTSPVIGAPAFAQSHALAAPDLTASSPAIGLPLAREVYNLSADNLTVASPVIGAPVIAQHHEIEAVIVIDGPDFDLAILAQHHFLDVNALTTGPPEFGSPTVVLPPPLQATPLATGSPVIQAAAFASIHHFTADPITIAAPTFGSPAATHIHVLQASLTTASPEIGAPALAQHHGLAAAPLTCAGPVLENGPFAETNGLQATAVTVSGPTFSPATVVQAHHMATTGLDVAPPAMGTPLAVEVVALGESGLTTASPTVGAPAFGQGHSVAAGELAPAGPSMPRPALRQTHHFEADDLEVSRPKIGQPAFSWPGIRDGRLIGRPIRRVRFLLHHDARVRLLAADDGRDRTLRRPRPRVRLLGH